MFVILKQEYILKNINFKKWNAITLIGSFVFIGYFISINNRFVNSNLSSFSSSHSTDISAEKNVHGDRGSKNVRYTTPGGFTRKDFHIYLLIGQSNMAGRGELQPLDTLDSTYLFTGTGWEDANNPLNKYSTVRKRIDLQKMGPGYTFARKLSKSTGKGIGLVVNARGGSNIDQWQKNYSGPNDYDLYEEAVKRLKVAKKDGVFKGIIWHQGESNQNSTSTYMGKLKKLVEDLRWDLDQNVFFVAGELGKWRESSNNFNQLIQHISDSINYSDYVSSNGLRPINNDLGDPHFDDYSQRVLGQLYADKILEQVYHVSAGVATLYSACNYAGYKVSLEEGTFSCEELESRGMHLQNIASLRLEPGYEAIIFTGDKEELPRLFQKPIDCLKDANVSENVLYITIGKISEK